MTEYEVWERVVIGLECCNANNMSEVCNCPYEQSHKSDMCLFELHEDAIALLKAQEQLEPRKLMEKSKIGYKWRFYCSRCGNEIDRLDKFCKHCGQAVKWE